MCFNVFPYLTVFLCNFAALLAYQNDNRCSLIHKALNDANKQSDNRASCQCLIESPTTKLDSYGTWIECTGIGTLEVLKKLNLTEEVHVSKLRIYSSSFENLSSEYLEKIKPSRLVIQNSGVKEIDPNTFSKCSFLKSLGLSKNGLTKFNNNVFSGLGDLIELDLSENRIRSLTEKTFEGLNSLETLLLNGNQLEYVAFPYLANLKTLSLSNNKLKTIEKDILKNLHGLETLDLSNNEIVDVSSEVFASLTSLKIRLDNLPNLKKIILNNNSLDLAHITFRNLPNLSILNLDMNKIQKIFEEDLRISFGLSVQLTSLSIDDNEISEIECAFDHMQNLQVLSLQKNQIKSISCQPKRRDKTMLIQSVFLPLTKLNSLFLSNNNIKIINSGDLNVLPSLKELSLDHNNISKIYKDAFEGLQLRKLFLNNNRLYYLPFGLFDGWDVSQIISIDLDNNPWDCICEKEWIGQWMKENRFFNAAPESVTCLLRCQVSKSQIASKSVSEPESYEFWITGFAAILALVAIIFLAISAYIYLQENCCRLPSISIGRIPSDKIRLIPSQESLLSFPNPIVHGELLKSSIKPQNALSTISYTVNERQEMETEPKQDKKKVVRFYDA